MIKLKLLGRAALESEQGPIAQRAIQRRRIALLALLAVARKPVSREKITAYLWPESDSEQARHLLSVAVYELRKAIHDDLIVSTRDEIELSSQHISNDAADFEAALAAGELARAVELYEGPFMDGFHINDAPEFERWMDSERDRLARAYAGALERLAQEYTTTGKSQEAVTVLRKLSAHDPYSGRVAAMLMSALESCGDRSGALQHARIHATLLKEEFGADPDPAVEALADRLRREPREATVAWQGEQRQHVEPKQQVEVVAVPWQKRSVILPAAITAVLTVILLVAFVYWRFTRVPPADATTAQNVTVAVLPFRNMTANEANTTFSDGISDEIINALSSVTSLNVVGRTSSFSFRGAEDIRDVGEKLGAQYVLEGSVRTGGDRLRVSAALIDTKTGFKAWSDDYDKPFATPDLLAIQDEIAGAVVSQLRAKLAPDAQAPVFAQQSLDIRAVQDFMAGRNFLYRRTVPDMKRALDFFDRAIARDSGYAIAYAGRAEALALLGAYDYGAMRPVDAFPAARAAAERALQLNPGLAEAHTTLAAIHFNFERDWPAAERAFLRAIELNKGLSTAHLWYALQLNAQQRHPEAYKNIVRALEIEPASPVTATGLARHYYFMRDFERATTEYRRVLAYDSTFITAYVGLGITYAASGKYTEAVQQFDKVIQLLKMQSPMIYALKAYAHGRGGQLTHAQANRRQLLAITAGHYVPTEIVAMAHIGVGDTTAAIEALRQAAENRSGGVNYLKIDPLVDPIRSDPRFTALINRVIPKNR